MVVVVWWRGACRSRPIRCLPENHEDDHFSQAWNQDNGSAAEPFTKVELKVYLMDEVWI